MRLERIRLNLKGVKMAAVGKKYKKVSEKVNPEKAYPVADASTLLKEISFTKFDPTIEIAMNLGVDPRHADQNVRGAVVLPNGLGRKVRVLVFAKGEKIKEAEAAGADYVGGDDLAEKIKNGWIDFEASIATPGTGKPLRCRGHWYVPHPNGELARAFLRFLLRVRGVQVFA
jgi:ribosomal protein L1